MDDQRRKQFESGGWGVLNHQTKEKNIFPIFDPQILSVIANKKQTKKFVAKPPLPLTSVDAHVINNLSRYTEDDLEQKTTQLPISLNDKHKNYLKTVTLLDRELFT